MMAYSARRDLDHARNPAAMYTAVSHELSLHSCGETLGMPETPDGAAHIIQATNEHLEALATLFDGYRQFYGEQPDLDGARAFLAERIEREESVLLLAVLDQHGQERPTGLAQLYPSFSSASMQRLWILNDLYVAPEGRRHGVGRALLQAAREHAERTQAKGLELMTARDNYAAQALYESMGWQRDEVFLPYTLYF
jgi:GNAT superfamily N-acetyltransferase